MCSQRMGKAKVVYSGLYLLSASKQNWGRHSETTIRVYSPVRLPLKEKPAVDGSQECMVHLLSLNNTCLMALIEGQVVYTSKASFMWTQSPSKVWIKTIFFAGDIIVKLMSPVGSQSCFPCSASRNRLDSLSLWLLTSVSSFCVLL